MSLRRLIRVLHRDVGYFLVGLTVFYCISGVAVNHVDAWNPSYSIRVEPVDAGPLPAGDLDALERAVVERLHLDPEEVAGRHRPDPGTFVVFLPHGGEARLAIATGRGSLKRVRPRPVLFESNVLHLNHLKGIWTYVADAYAVLLLGLALTGMFILKGRQGLGGRGKWFVGAGFLLPIGFLAFYYATR